MPRHTTPRDDHQTKGACRAARRAAIYRTFADSRTLRILSVDGNANSVATVVADGTSYDVHFRDDPQHGIVTSDIVCSVYNL